jgi:lipopolysaccharide transport system permease protein
MNATADVRETVIEPSHGWVALRFYAVWEYRELLYFLAWRDIKVRYKQTLLGAAWAILQPVLTMVVFSVFFGKLAGMPSGGMPYPIFAFAALVPWQLFSNGLTHGANSVVGSANLVKKVYFPRLCMPLASALGGLVDFALAFLVLLAMMLAYGLAPTGAAAALPLFLLLALCTSVGASLWLAAMNVQFRDVRFTVPFITQLWLFATPVAYPSTLLDEPWRTVYGLNPMAAVVEGFRWTLLGAEMPSRGMLIMSAVAALLLLGSGLVYFRRMERTFADVV